ncbi:MAG: hypothetical protein WDW38_006028 [Sanguina aurantia]
MGGGLAFLNKKTWHPGSFRNQEEVWKREQQAAAEQRKVEELQKQMQEERKQDEFHQLAADHGKVQKSERLDWMYSGGLAAKEDAAKRAEEHMLGKPAVLAAEPQDASRCEQAANLSAVGGTAVPATVNESWRRLHNDPLFAHRGKAFPPPPPPAPPHQQQQRQDIQHHHHHHPQQQQQQQQPHSQQQQLSTQHANQNVGGPRRRHDSQSPSRSRTRSRSRSPPPRNTHGQPQDRHRPTEHHHHHQHHNSGRDGHSSHHQHPQQQQMLNSTHALNPRRPEGAGIRGATTAVGPRTASQPAHGMTPHATAADAMTRGMTHTVTRTVTRGSTHAATHATTPDLPATFSSSGSSSVMGVGMSVCRCLVTTGTRVRTQSSRRGGDRRAVRADDGSTASPSSPSSSSRGKRGVAPGGSERVTGQVTAAAMRSARAGRQTPTAAPAAAPAAAAVTAMTATTTPARTQGAEMGGQVPGTLLPGGLPALEACRCRGGESPPGPVTLDPSATGIPGLPFQPEWYGLTRSTVAPSAAHGRDAGAAAAATRARLSEGARARDEEAGAKAALAHSSRKEYKTGRMTDEEKATRLAEMMGNSDAHEAGRLERMKRARDAEGGPDTLVKSTGSGPRNNNAFMQAATRDVYSAMVAGGTTIESRVSSRKHFNMK